MAKKQEQVTHLAVLVNRYGGVDFDEGTLTFDSSPTAEDVKKAWDDRIGGDIEDCINGSDRLMIFQVVGEYVPPTDKGTIRAVSV